jgi:hypothetical protein
LEGRVISQIHEAEEASEVDGGVIVPAGLVDEAIFHVVLQAHDDLY